MILNGRKEENLKCITLTRICSKTFPNHSMPKVLQEIEKTPRVFSLPSQKLTLLGAVILKVHVVRPFIPP